MGVYKHNNGTLTPIANETQFIAPVNEYVTKPELEAIVPNDTSAENKLVNSDEVDDKVNDIWKAQGKLGAKNLLVYPYDANSNTRNGVTYNGIVSTSGISTGYTFFPLKKKLLLEMGDYIISDGCPNKVEQYFVVWYKHGDVTDTLATIRNNTFARFSITQEQADAMKNGEAYAVIRLASDNSNVNWNNLTFYPMIRLASDTDNTWQPYVPTNKELVDTQNALAPIIGEYLPLSSSTTQKKRTVDVGGTWAQFYVGGFVEKYGITSASELVLEPYAETQSGKIVVINRIVPGLNLIQFQFDELTEAATFICKCSKIQ